MAVKKIKNKKPKGDVGYKKLNKYPKKQLPAGVVGKKQAAKKTADSVPVQVALSAGGKAGRPNPSIYNY